MVNSDLARCAAAVKAVVADGVKVQVEQPGHLKIAGHLLLTLLVTPPSVKNLEAALDSHPQTQLVVAPVITPGMQELLRQRAVNWVDETAAASVISGPLVIIRPSHDRSSASPEKAVRWAPALIVLAEAILEGRSPTVQSLAQTTGLAVGTCVKGLRTLETQGYLRAVQPRGPRSARAVARPSGLLQEYVRQTSWRPDSIRITVGVSWRDLPREVGRLGLQWTRAGMPWAVSSGVAAHLVAAHLSNLTHGLVYVQAFAITDLLNAASTARVSPLEGGRLTLAAFPHPAMARLRSWTGEMCLAPWPRIYRDLRAEGVRGETAAEHFLQHYDSAFNPEEASHE